jgi:hypothetical protein
MASGLGRSSLATWPAPAALTLCAASILILVAAPVQAALPLAFLAKQIVQQVVKDFVKSQLNSMVRESLGPCKSMLADMGVGAVGTIQGLVSGGASIPSMLTGGMPGMPGMAGMPAGMPPGMEAAMRAQMMEAMPAMPPGMLDMPGMDPAMRAQVMQMMAGMQGAGGMPGGMPGMGNAAPLSNEEADELVTRLVALSKAMPENPLPCSPEDLKLVFNMSATMPMMSGPFRMILTQFRAMDERFKEVEETFAKMSSAEQAEAVELMVADAKSMSAQDRKQLASFLQSDLIPLPAAVREQLRIRLGGQ